MHAIYSIQVKKESEQVEYDYFKVEFCATSNLPHMHRHFRPHWTYRVDRSIRVQDHTIPYHSNSTWLHTEMAHRHRVEGQDGEESLPAYTLQAAPTPTPTSLNTRHDTTDARVASSNARAGGSGGGAGLGGGGLGGLPGWAPDTSKSLQYGARNDASEDAYTLAELWCGMHPPAAPFGRDVPVHIQHMVHDAGVRAWTMELQDGGRDDGFTTTGVSVSSVSGSADGRTRTSASGYERHGVVHVRSQRWVSDTCLVSNLPILWAAKNPNDPLQSSHKTGASVGSFYEVEVYALTHEPHEADSLTETSAVKQQGKTQGHSLFGKMKSLVGGRSPNENDLKTRTKTGIVSIGAAVLPYPQFRHPGWNRLSVGMHSDDGNKFFEDPLGGRPYCREIVAGDVVGFLIRHGATGDVEYYLNGEPLGVAFSGLWFPRDHFDVYACIGLDGPVHIGVNFGGAKFRYPPPPGTSLTQYVP